MAASSFWENDLNSWPGLWDPEKFDSFLASYTCAMLLSLLHNTHHLAFQLMPEMFSSQPTHETQPQLPHDAFLDLLWSLGHCLLPPSSLPTLRPQFWLICGFQSSIVGYSKFRRSEAVFAWLITSSAVLAWYLAHLLFEKTKEGVWQLLWSLSSPWYWRWTWFKVNTQ